MATSTSNPLPEFYAETIHDIGENFAEKFKRAFNNEGNRLRKAHKSIDLDDVAFSCDNIYLNLAGMKLAYPEFRISNLQIDLEQAVVNYRLTVGKLLFQSRMRTITMTRFLGLFTHASAQLQWTLHNINITGSAGLFRTGDSFVTRNIRNVYAFESGEIEQFVDGEQLPESTTFLHKESSLFKIVETSVYAALSAKIQRQMDVIVEFSASELLLDERDEITAYDEYLGRRTLRANLLVDSVINRAKTAAHFRSTAGDGADAKIATHVFLPYRRANASTRHLLIARGRIDGMHTFTRLRDCSISEYGDELRVSAELGLTDYKFIYEYSTQYEGFRFAGNITAKVYQNTWMLALTKRTGQNPAIGLTVDKIGDIEVDYSNLGSLTWLTESIRRVIVGHIKAETGDRVRDFLAKQLQSAALQVPFFKDYHLRSH